MREWLVVLLLAAHGACAPLPPATRGTDDGELVVLVHGLGRTPWSMVPLERALEREGYRVLNWGYSSTSATIPELGEALGREVDRTASAGPVHFVGHSLGNIIVRHALEHHRPGRTGRVVMLAPPNRGARIADRYAPWLGWLLRPLPELTTGPGSTARSLPPPEGIEIGIIAGSRDRKVLPDETRLDGVGEWTVVPAGHTFLMARTDVQSLVLQFLRSGRFGVEVEGPEPRSPTSGVPSAG